MPLLDTALASLVNVASSALVTGDEAPRFGNAHASIVPYQTFRAADGWIAVAAANDGLFVRLCEALGRPELAADPRFDTNPERVRNRGALVPALESAFAQRSTDDWLRALDEAGVPAGKVRGVLEALRRTGDLGRPATTTVEHPTAGCSSSSTRPFASTPACARRSRRRCSGSTPPPSSKSSATARPRSRSSSGAASSPTAG